MTTTEIVTFEQHALPLVNTLLILLVALVFYHRSRQWTGISQNARIEKQDARLSIAEANIRSLRADMEYFTSTYQETLDEVLKEVRSITRNGAKEHAIETRLTALQDQVMAIEQDVTGLPCFVGSKLLCQQDKVEEKG
jgi:hypothetical protein